LRFRYTDPNVNVETRLARLFEAGCDDALPGIGRSEGMALAFTRAAESAREALLSAIADALAAMPDARLVEASPDLVGITDAAREMGFTRQNMRKLVYSAGDHAPAPVHAGNPALWHLADLLGWLESRGYGIDRLLHETAAVTMQVNLALELTRADPAVQRDIVALVR
jgi:hypothetical protein